MDINKLMEQRKQAYDAMHEIREVMTKENRTELTAQEQEKWEQANAAYDKYDKLIAAEQEWQKREASMSARTAPVPGRENAVIQPNAVTEETRALALQGWARMQQKGVCSDDQMHAMQAVGLNPAQKELSIRLSERVPKTEAECRALSVTTTAGGYTVPQGFVYNLEKALLFYGGIRQAATVLRTNSGNTLPWPTANDTSNSGALIAINTQDATNVDPTFGVVTFDAYKYTSKIVLVPYELLEDSAFNMAEILPAMLGERLGRAQNTACTTGTGSSQPNGVITAATTGVTAASATAITADELIDLQHSVDPAYRANGMCKWMFHDSVLKYIRKLKDGQSNYLWQVANIAGGAPSTILGDPYIISSAMASTVQASAKTVLYGDLSKYVIREVNDIRIYRMVERYRDYDQDGFVALLRFDGDLVNAGTNPVKLLVQASGS